LSGKRLLQRILVDAPGTFTYVAEIAANPRRDKLRVLPNRQTPVRTAPTGEQIFPASCRQFFS